MPSAHDTQELYSLGRYSEALKSLRAVESSRSLLTGEEVMLAELLAVTGELESAIRISDRLLKQRDLSVKQRCRIRGTLGLCYFRNGNNNHGAEQYRAGIELAEHSNEFLEECTLRVHLFADQVRWLGPHPAAAGLSALRRKIHQAAEPAIAVTFQLALAELAAKLALLPRARKHLETARALLKSVPNRELHLSFRRSEVALATEEGDFTEALRGALELVPETDSDTAMFSVNIMLSHLLIAQGRFDEAEKWLKRSLDDPRLSGGRSIALRDTMMLLRVREGKLDEAGLVSESIERQLNETSAADSFFGLWYLLSRVKWLYHSQRVREGLAVAVEAIPRIERIADRNLLDRMRLLIAEGFALTDEPYKGAVIVAEVARGNPDPSLELIAETWRIAGKLASVDSPTAARAYFDRASQTLEVLGHLAAKSEVERDRQESLSIGKGSDNRPATAQVTERIARLIEVGSHPALLATEALSLIVDTGAVHFANIVKIHPDGRRELCAAYRAPGSSISVQDNPHEVRISVGGDRNRHYEIALLPFPTSAARITVSSLERLLTSALILSGARQLEREKVALWPEQTPEQQLGLICASERMLDLVKTIRRVAASNVTVLLTGETGVGKELFARALHQASSRRDKVFMPFNCATVPRDMFDGQLFGHRRGSFTGAVDDAAGVIRSAAGGTLLLDEIGEMALDAQPKLLRFLESGEIRPLGDPRPQLVDVRVVAATNANLEQLVAEGRFREDLYYRLNVIRIPIPPLRERREEIPALVDHFLELYGRELQKPQLRVADETLEYLVLYRWPGNVRQLANEIRRMTALAEPGAVLMPAHLSDDLAASRKTIPTKRPELQSTEVLTRLDQPLTAVVEHVERAAIQRAVAVAEGNLIEAAKMLGLSRKGLYLKRQRLGLE